MRVISAGNSSFEAIRENGYFYIDRTAFLDEWYHSGDYVTLITRPRRFGKTLTLDMLNCFFSQSYANRADLFEGLDIATHDDMMQMQGTKPVVFISFANRQPSSYMAFFHMMVNVLARLYAQHRYLLSGDTLTAEEKKRFSQVMDDTAVIENPDFAKNRDFFEGYVTRLQSAVQDLCVWMQRYFGEKVILLMDEYDTPLQSAYIHGYWNEALELMRSFFGLTLKTNPALDRAVITGITRIAKESLFSDLNHLMTSSILSDRYSQTFGFTQAEVDAALEEFGILDTKEQVQAWYDGFTFGSATHLYNPWSICCFLGERGHPFKAYWAHSGGLGLLDHLMRHGNEKLHTEFQQLLVDGKIECKISEELIFPELLASDMAGWSLLLAAGYVKPVKKHAPVMQQTEDDDWFAAEDADLLTLALTNLEMRRAFVSMTRRWFEVAGVNYVSVFLSALVHCDLATMQEALQQVVLVISSSFDLATGPRKTDGDHQPEKYFQGLMTGLVAGALDRYKISSNGESGLGRYDLTLEPKRLLADAFQMEFKVFDTKRDKTLQDTVRRAMQQMWDKKYDTKLLAAGFRREQIHQFGIGFRGKEVLIQEV